MSVKKTMEFLSWFWRDLLDYFCARHRARIGGDGSASLPMGQTPIAAGRWQPVRSQGKAVLGPLVRALGQVDRHLIEVCVVALVTLPLMGYYFSIAVPAVMKFWLGRV